MTPRYVGSIPTTAAKKQDKDVWLMLVSEASKLLGINPQTLRLALQQGKFPQFGTAIKTSKKRYVYYINEKRLMKYLEGGDINQLETYSNIGDISSDIGRV